MPKNVVCKKCNNLVNDWCEKVIDSPDPDMQRDCQHFCEKTNAQKIRSMSDDELNELFHDIVHAKIQRLIADTPTVENVEQVVRCKDCQYFEPVWGDELLGRCTQAKAWYENRCTWDYCSNGGTTETAEPQPDGIQFRTVDDLGRICIPKDIREKLGIKPGTECSVYATDELTSEQIIVIQRK